jgi:hypothetical protein
MDTINKDFCCHAMSLWIQDIDCPFMYNAYDRYYTMTAPKTLMQKNSVWPCYKVYFCPYCGMNLPKDLIDERFEILEKEYGIDDPYDPIQKKLIPEEFMTDEWWKKRNL